ncbi:MAG: DUF5677 domain-containing protein [Hyphomicrobiaceae bacterium]
MSFRELGYLSPESAQWIVTNRRDHGGWFSHVDRLNRLAQRTLFAASADEDSNRELVSILLFVRAVFHFQAVVLLAERGMTVEARSLARGSLEAAFCLRALVANEGFLDQLVRADTHHRKNIVAALTSPSHRHFLDPSRIPVLDSFLIELKSSGKTAALNMEQVAKMGGLHEVYQTIYRGLSGDASHVSASSLNRYIAEPDEGRATIAVGPVVPTGEIDETLQAASLALHACLDGLASLLRLDAIAGELGALRSQYHDLTERMSHGQNTDTC